MTHIHHIFNTKMSSLQSLIFDDRTHNFIEPKNIFIYLISLLWFHFTFHRKVDQIFYFGSDFEIFHSLNILYSHSTALSEGHQKQNSYIQIYLHDTIEPENQSQKEINENKIHPI